MIKDIITDKAILSQVSEPLVDGEELTDLLADLIDTASVDYENTPGLAAIQIGYAKRVFLLKINGNFVPMLNPVIVKRFGGMASKPERCLSMPGITRKVSRYKRVRLAFNDYRDGNRVEFNFKGFTARVIQHEICHLDGKTI